MDSSYECVYCREVLEHLSYYEKSVSEFIRIASKEVIIVFFIPPNEQDDQINYWEAEDLYHNVYSKKKLEKYILANPKVEALFWSDVNDLGYVPRRHEDELQPDELGADMVADQPNNLVEMPTVTKHILHIILKA